MVNEMPIGAEGWRVRIETAAPPGIADDEEGNAFAKVLHQLRDYAAQGDSSDTYWDLVLTIDACTAGEALDSAMALINDAARVAGMPWWPVVDMRVVAANLKDENGEVDGPSVMGVQEVREMLNITKQRLSQLRRQGRFPEPMVELGATPVWLRTSIEHFVAGWDRRAGRRRLWPLDMLSRADEITLIRSVPDSTHPNIMMIGVWLDEDHDSAPSAEPVKAFETSAQDFFCASFSMLGLLIHAAVGNLGGLGLRFPNRHGLAA